MTSSKTNNPVISKTRLKRILFLIAFIPAIAMAQYTIEGVFSPANEFEFALLYKVTPSNSVYIKNCEVNEEGHFTFEMDSTLTKGMYRIVYALPQEEYNFDIIYNAKENVALTFNTETGIEYQESMENKLIRSYTYSMSLVSQSIGNFFNQQSSDSLALASIFKTQRETQANYEEAAKETFALHFIKANRPYIPEGFEDIKTYIKNLKAHFFDHVDFNNEVLQSSNFLIERLLNYVFGMILQGDDEYETYKSNIDKVVTAMSDADIIIKKRLLEVLWQQMADTNLEAIANYIAQSYLIEIAQALNDMETVNRLTIFKSLSLGNPAPDFEIVLEEEPGTETIWFSELDNAKTYIIVFWSSNCSHCLEEIPELQSFISALEEGHVQVVAIGLEDEPKRWSMERLNFPEFTHVLGLGKWKNEIGNHYNITGTPTYFVINADKNIIAKPKDVDTLIKFLSDSQ